MVQVSSAVAKTAALAMLAMTAVPTFAQAQQATTVAATASTSAPQQAQKPFTKDECRFIMDAASEVVATYGANKLSVDFRKSFMGWMGNVTCDGPRDIVIRTGADADVFNSIRGGLSISSSRIDLVTRAGLRIARPTAALGSGG
jgi:hypothetical protein